MPKECAFCPSTAKKTGEHVWSDWINQFLPSTKFRFVKRNKDNLPEREWHESRLNLKTHVVCGKCNSTWMSEIDDKEAKPILRHLIAELRPRKMSFSQLVSIGIFAFKSAVVGDLMTTGGESFFTKEERYAFRETLRIPAGIFMWLGAFPHTGRGTFKTRHIEPKAGSKYDFGLYVFTYAAGHFVLQLVAVRWSTYNPKKPLPVIEQSDGFSSAMIPFWPPVMRSILWPPGERLTDQSLDELADRWKTLRRATI